MEEPEYSGHGDNSDAIVESQSAQLLDFVLGRTETTQARDGNNAQPHENDTGSSADHHSNSKASGDTSYYISASTSPYHFHGLANTQSPTQVINREDSLKENDHAQAHASKRPLTPSRVISTEQLSPHTPRPPPQTTKPVTVQSSARHASTKEKERNPIKEKTPAMRYRRRPSPPIPSQDSFAGPTASQDPDLFIATSRQFDIPVDQLGLPHSQDRSPVESRAPRSSVASSVPVATKAAMDEYSLSSSSSTGRILVAASQSSNRSQGSDGKNYYSISQEPTQIVGDGSDVGVSDHANEVEEVDEVPDASTRVEPTQASNESNRTQEPTQIVEETRSIVHQSSDAHGPSVVSDRLSALSLVPPEKRARYMHHFAEKGDERTEPAPGPSGAGGATEPSPISPSIASGKRSLLDGLPPEKRARYMHHFQKNEATDSVSEASRMATAGTSLGVGSSEQARWPIPPTIEEGIVQDSERQVEMELSPVKQMKTRDQEVIPASESDAADNSREEEEDEVDAGLDTAKDSPIHSPLPASAKGKQKATPLANVMSPRKQTKSKVSPFGSPSKLGKPVAPTQPSPSTAQTRAKRKSPNRAEEGAMKPPPDSESRRRGGPGVITRAIGPDTNPTSPLPSTSTVALHRVQESPPPTPTLVVPGSSQDSPEIPLAKLIRRREEEEESEAGDVERGEEEEGEEEEEEEEERPRTRRARGPQSATRKRKRRNAPLTTKKGGRGKAAATRKVTSTSRAASVAPPPPKKARTNVVKRFGAGLGTQVFALFKSNSSYYGAEVHSLSGSRAHVKFFDGLDDPSLGIAQMRRFELRQGDIVIPGNSTHKAKVVDDSLWASENMVNVGYIEGPDEGLETSVTVMELRIPSKIIQSQWKDRVLDVSEVVPAVPRRTLKDTPSPSKNSVVNVASARFTRNKLLSKYGVIITQAPGNQNWSREKEKYVSIVKENGGTVLSDWLDVFSLHGKHTNGNRRWTIQPSDVRYVPKDKHTFDRVFLVSDVHNQKPKFLLALALGIPCVSVEWLDRLAYGEEVPWSRYLLAAGHSEPLGAPVSQMVDLDWGSSAEHMMEIMENPIPLKVLRGTSVLCVGLDLFPQPPKKFTTEADRTLEASRTVPRIILAMGADRVEAVVDPKHASSPLSRYDYIVIKEGNPHPRVSGASYVSVNWIKECLIAGRLFSPSGWEG